MYNPLGEYPIAPILQRIQAVFIFQLRLSCFGYGDNVIDQG
jgi:hypothetical protein